MDLRHAVGRIHQPVHGCHGGHMRRRHGSPAGGDIASVLPAAQDVFTRGDDVHRFSEIGKPRAGALFVDRAHDDRRGKMGRAGIPGVFTEIPGCHDDRDAFFIGVFNTFLEIFVVGVASQAQVDHLCAFADRIADPVSGDGRIAQAGRVHHTDRKDVHIEPRRAVDDRAGHMGPVPVLVRRVIVIVDEILSGEEPALELCVAGDAGVHDSDLDRSFRIRFYIGGIFVGLDIGHAPGHRGGCGREGGGLQGGVIRQILPRRNISNGFASGTGGAVRAFRRSPLPALHLQDLHVPGIQPAVIRLRIDHGGERIEGGSRLFRRTCGSKLDDRDAVIALHDGLGPVSGKVDCPAVLYADDQARRGIGPELSRALHR